MSTRPGAARAAALAAVALACAQPSSARAQPAAAPDVRCRSVHVEVEPRDLTESLREELAPVLRQRGLELASDEQVADLALILTIQREIGRHGTGLTSWRGKVVLRAELRDGFDEPVATVPPRELYSHPRAATQAGDARRDINGVPPSTFIPKAVQRIGALLDEGVASRGYGVWIGSDPGGATLEVPDLRRSGQLGDHRTPKTLGCVAKDRTIRFTLKLADHREEKDERSAAARPEPLPVQLTPLRATGGTTTAAGDGSAATGDPGKNSSPGGTPGTPPVPDWLWLAAALVLAVAAGGLFARRAAGGHRTTLVPSDGSAPPFLAGGGPVHGEEASRALPAELREPIADIEIEITPDGDELLVRAHGSRGERPSPHSLGPDVHARRLAEFTAQVAAVAQKDGSTLQELPLEEAQALHRALFRGELQRVLDSLSGEARADARRGPPLVRLLLRDPILQATPWEALCRSSSHELLGVSTDFHVARAVASREPYKPRSVSGAVRLLVIAPMAGGGTPDLLEGVLAEWIATGEVELLPPIASDLATPSRFFAALRQRMALSPHVIHFVGHGGLDEHRQPILQIADDGGQPDFVPVGLLAQELAAAGATGDLRLVYLQACEGATPGAFGSAAELLCKAGVDAVVAHLWPVRAEAARLCARDFYWALAGEASPSKGDVVASVTAARRTLLLSSAEGVAPVVYLRGRSPLLFTFAQRKLRRA